MDWHKIEEQTVVMKIIQKGISKTDREINIRANWIYLYCCFNFGATV